MLHLSINGLVNLTTFWVPGANKFGARHYTLVLCPTTFKLMFKLIEIVYNYHVCRQSLQTEPETIGYPQRLFFKSH